MRRRRSAAHVAEQPTSQKPIRECHLSLCRHRHCPSWRRLATQAPHRCVQQRILQQLAMSDYKLAKITKDAHFFGEITCILLGP